MDMGNEILRRVIEGVRSHPVFGTHFNIYPEYPEENAYYYPAIAFERKFTGEVDKILGGKDILGVVMNVELAFPPTFQIISGAFRYGGEPLNVFLEREMRNLLDEMRFSPLPITMAEVVSVDQKNAIETEFNFYGFVMVFQVNYVED